MPNDETTSKRSASVSILGGAVEIILEEYPLVLRSTFGTSHSATNFRTNALFTIKISNGMEGFGEVGLPPKKKGCYLADVNDIFTYFEVFEKHIVDLTAKTSIVSSSISGEQVTLRQLLSNNDDNNTDGPYNPFGAFSSSSSSSGDGQSYFASLQPQYDTKMSMLHALPYVLLKALDTCPINQDPTAEFTRAARCGLEMAILDLWGHILQKPLYELIGIGAPRDKFSFYTAALNEDIAQIVDSARFGLCHTPYLKIKLDGDVEKGTRIMDRLHEVYASQTALPPYKWSIDANCAWTSEIALQYLEAIKARPHIMKNLYMIEQPFPVDFKYTVQGDETERQKWLKVKEAYEREGMLLFADESVSTYKDVELLKDFVHGVNVKLEKAGGIREALRAIIEAKRTGLKVWLGMMVASRLSSTASAHLMNLAEIGGDLDGSLLTTEDCQLHQGGFQFSKRQQEQEHGDYGRILVSCSEYGLGIKRK